MKGSIERRHPDDAFTELIWRESRRPLIVCYMSKYPGLGGYFSAKTVLATVASTTTLVVSGVSQS
jgi:hypothetical protein